MNQLVLDATGGVCSCNVASQQLLRTGRAVMCALRSSERGSCCREHCSWQGDHQQVPPVSGQPGPWQERIAEGIMLSVVLDAPRGRQRCTHRHLTQAPDCV